MTSNIILDNGLILTCYRMVVGEGVIKVWGTERPLFKAEITHNGVSLDVKVSTPVCAKTKVITINEAVKWLSEQWAEHKAAAPSQHEQVDQHSRFTSQWETLAAQNPPTTR